MLQSAIEMEVEDFLAQHAEPVMHAAIGWWSATATNRREILTGPGGSRSSSRGCETTQEKRKIASGSLRRSCRPTCGAVSPSTN